jgi:hypothetical protein
LGEAVSSPYWTVEERDATRKKVALYEDPNDLYPNMKVTKVRRILTTVDALEEAGRAVVKAQIEVRRIWIEGGETDSADKALTSRIAELAALLAALGDKP